MAKKQPPLTITEGGPAIPGMIRGKKFLPRRSGKSLKILIAGLGNLLLRDDGVGVQAARELQKNPPAGVMVVEVGTAVLDALHLFKWADSILAIDAMQAGGSAGTVYSLSVSDVDDRRPQGSLHELSLLAALRFLPSGKQPAILILGVEPEIVDFGLELSPKVEAALPTVIHSVREIVNSWRGRPRQPRPQGILVPRKIWRPVWKEEGRQEVVNVSAEPFSSPENCGAPKEVMLIHSAYLGMRTTGKVRSREGRNKEGKEE